MVTLLLIIFSTIVVSLISLIGIFFLPLKENTLESLLESLISFASGGLIGGAFFHLLPEAIETSGTNIFFMVIAGIILFFIIEKFFKWRHCHKGICDAHAFTYLNLLGDAVHNFLDGVVIAASFVINIQLGFVTTLAVIFHEIPQEIGDYGVLVYGGFSRGKALYYNFLCALTAVAGALLAYFSFSFIIGLKTFLLPFTAGGFIYVAMVDLIPELHKKAEPLSGLLQFALLLLGLIFMWAIKLWLI